MDALRAESPSKGAIRIICLMLELPAERTLQGVLTFPEWIESRFLDGGMELGEVAGSRRAVDFGRCRRGCACAVAAGITDWKTDRSLFKAFVRRVSDRAQSCHQRRKKCGDGGKLSLPFRR